MSEEFIENIVSEPVERYSSGKPNKKNDIIFKGAFEDYFVHLLRFTYPNADQVFDFSKKIEFQSPLSKKYVKN